MTDTLTIVVNGEVTLDEFADIIHDFSELVTALSNETGVSGLNWVLDDLQVSSAVATARGVGDPKSAETVVNAYAELGDELEQGNPKTHSEAVKSAATKIVSFAAARKKAVRFETADRESVITPGKVVKFPTGKELPKAAQDPAAVIKSPIVKLTPSPAFGAIQGRVQSLSNRGGLRFTLYDLFYDRPVSCYIAEGKEEILRNAWGKLAVVEGMISRDPSNGRPIAIRQIQNISILAEPTNDFDFRTIRGIAPILGGVSPEEAIRRVRDAQ